MIVAMRPLSWLSLTDIFGSLGGLQCGLYHSLFGVSLSVSACGEFEEGLGFFAWAVPAGTEFLAALTVFGGGPHFAAGLGGFALCGACDAGVIRLGEDVTIEHAAYCTGVRGRRCRHVVGMPSCI